MTGLVDAYQRREVHAAEKILRGQSFPSPGYSYFNVLSCREQVEYHGRQLHSTVYRRAST